MKKFTDKINESVEERIPTTEEFFKKYSSLLQFEEGDAEYLIDKDDFKEAMIEFTKLHVEAALKVASEKAQLSDILHEFIEDSWEGGDFIDKDTILNAYPLDKIN